MNICYVLNVTCQVPNNFPDDFEYKLIEINDLPLVNILVHLQEGVDFIQHAVNNGDKGGILVHCMAGQSRSASMVIAYLIQKKKISFSDTISFVKGKRQSISPNPGFLN